MTNEELKQMIANPTQEQIDASVAFLSHTDDHTEYFVELFSNPAAYMSMHRTFGVLIDAGIVSDQVPDEILNNIIFAVSTIVLQAVKENEAHQDERQSFEDLLDDVVVDFHGV